jgi:methylenetetrahydrofolate dehydrogenase (NADP+) / methenyltetrahydrofolate cyclohydrolase
MTPIIFDGKAFAKIKEIDLQKKVLQLKKKGITPKLVSIVVGDIDGAMKYQEMKKKAGERIGIEVEIVRFTNYDLRIKIETEIKKLNQDEKVHGIMIQLPLPERFTKEDRDILIRTIKPEKDVDGMNELSPFISPVVMAVLQAFKEARERLPRFARNDVQIAVVGAEGFEGKKIVKAFQAWGYHVEKLDRKIQNAVFINHEISHSDVVVSCTGSQVSIVGEVIKPDAICIDVGAPKGDFDFESVSAKASFITPVPGGIGPVTIISLMENIVIASEEIGSQKSEIR